MIELIDSDNNVKLMALIICGIKYGDDNYLLYSIKRDDVDDNIFVSKVVKNSQGYVISNDFLGGEKEVLDLVVKRILSKDSISSLLDDGIEIIKDIDLVSVNKFSVSLCYVTTFSRDLIKDVMTNYGLLDINYVRPVVREKDVSGFSQGSVSSVFLVGFGVFIIVFCIGILIEIYLR